MNEEKLQDEEVLDLMDMNDGDFYDEEDFIDDYEIRKESDAGAWASLVMGVIGSLGWIVPVIGLPVTIVGTIFGAINMKNKKNKGVAIAGFVTNLVFMLVAIAKGIFDIISYIKKSKQA